MARKHWQVQIAEDDWEGVTSDRVMILDSGVIEFSNNDGSFIIAYSPHRWMAFFEDDE